MFRRMTRIIKDERALSYMEYLLLTMLVGFSIFGLSRLFIRALVSYLSRIYFIVSLPIP